MSFVVSILNLDPRHSDFDHNMTDCSVRNTHYSYLILLFNNFKSKRKRSTKLSSGSVTFSFGNEETDTLKEFKFNINRTPSLDWVSNFSNEK